jgi:hypothetical protein
MQYLRAYQYPFDNPKWINNLLFCALCVFIPVIGVLLLMGYLFEVFDALHRRKSDKVYPDFTFDRFKEYLVRGAWPFLVQLVIGLPVGMVLSGGFFVLSLLLGLIAGEKAGCLFLIFYGFMMLFLAVASVALQLIIMPMVLRAGLIQDFKSAFSLEFTKDFLRRAGKELLLAYLFLMVSAWVLILIGYIACLVGVYPAVALIHFAQFHLWWQVYEIYLQRGGTPIPLKEPAAAVSPVEPAAGASPIETTIPEGPVAEEPASRSDPSTAPFFTPEPPPKPPPPPPA